MRKTMLINTMLFVFCRLFVVLHRVAKRGKMTRAQIEAIIARQMPDAEKRARADVVIRTGLSRFETVRALRRLIAKVLA